MDPRDNIYNPYHPYYRMGNGMRKDASLHPTMPYPDGRTDTSVVQSRILELRKEKSRDAARSRRGKENHEFYELAKMLPLPPAITSQLDKASIIRLTISYLKLREFALNGLPSWVFPTFGHLHTNSALKNKICHAFDSQQGQHILQSLDGFMFLLGQDGRFLYISETVSIYLGLSQTEVIGSSIFDYCHQADHAELALNLGLSNLNSNNSTIKKSLNGKQFNSSLNGTNSSPLPPSSVCSNGSADSDPSSYSHFSSSSNSYYNNQVNTINAGDKLERQFCIRIKSALSKRGCQHFKSNGYRVVQIIAQLRPQLIAQTDQQRNNLLESNAETNSNSISNLKSIGLVAVAICLPAPTVNDLRLESDTFVMRLGLDFRILHCEPKVSELFDYNSDELVNRSLYGLVHGQDMCYLRKAHVELIHKGQIMTRYYRLINKNGGYTWIQSCATLISNSLQPNTPTQSNDTSSPSLNANSPNSVNGNLNNGSTNNCNKNTSNTNLSTNNNDDQFEQSIICINYVISKQESENLILDTSQIPDNQNKLKQQRSLNNNNNTKLQLTHLPPSPPPLQPPAKKISNSKRQQNLANNHQSNLNNLTSPPNRVINNNLSTQTANNNSNLCTSIKQSPNSSPCQSPLTNSNNLNHNQLLPIHHHLNHHSTTLTTNSDSDDIPCNNENNHNTMNSVDLLVGAQQPITTELKRRRYAASSSPVRPWKNSPSPITNQLTNSHLNTSINEKTNMTNALLSTQHLLLGTAVNNHPINNSQLHLTQQQTTQLNPLLNSSLTCSSPESVCSSSSLNGSSSMASNSNLLRHISVIRETPPILKSQLVSNYHQQNFSNQTINNQHNHLHYHSANHLMATNNTLVQHHQLTNDLTNGHQNANNLINHHNNSPVHLDHLGQLNQHLVGITNNNMTQHLVAQQQQHQQNTSAISPNTNNLIPIVATAQSPYQQITNTSNSHHHSLHNTNQTAQTLNANVEQHALMHQALTHPLTHANHHYTNHLTNQLHTGHHPSLVDPYAAAAAALHHWSSYN